VDHEIFPSRRLIKRGNWNRLLSTISLGYHHRPQSLIYSAFTIKMVSLRTIAVSAMALTAPLAQALTAQQIVTNINALTTKSQALQGPALSITVVNGPLVAIGLGPIPVRTSSKPRTIGAN
jgi:hypothetical protein